MAKAIWKGPCSIKEKNETNLSKSAFKVTKNRLILCLISMFLKQKQPRRNLRSERRMGAHAEICLVFQILAHAVLRRLFSSPSLFKIFRLWEGKSKRKAQQKRPFNANYLYKKVYMHIGRPLNLMLE